MIEQTRQTVKTKKKSCLFETIGYDIDVIIGFDLKRRRVSLGGVRRRCDTYQNKIKCHSNRKMKALPFLPQTFNNTLKNK